MEDASRPGRYRATHSSQLGEIIQAGSCAEKLIKFSTPYRFHFIGKRRIVENEPQFDLHASPAPAVAATVRNAVHGNSVDSIALGETAET